MGSSADVALVTGGTGFVGSALVPVLADRGWTIHAVVRPTSDRAAVARLQGHAAIHVDDGSAASLDRIVRLCRPTHCFHLASKFVAVHDAEDVSDLILSNVGFPTGLAQALAGSGCRFVNAGSAWQHHDGRAYSPASLYAATKQALQDILQFYGECVGIDVVNVKLCDTYGPADQRGKLVELLLRAARERDPLALSGGEQLVDLVHVADVVDALEAAALAPSLGAPTSYCVTSGEAISIRELVDRIQSVIGTSIDARWGERPYRQREMLVPWVVDPIVPGWTPRVSLADGIRALWDTAGASPVRLRSSSGHT